MRRIDASHRRGMISAPHGSASELVFGLVFKASDVASETPNASAPVAMMACPNCTPDMGCDDAGECLMGYRPTVSGTLQGAGMANHMADCSGLEAAGIEDGSRSGLTGRAPKRLPRTAVRRAAVTAACAAGVLS